MKEYSCSPLWRRRSFATFCPESLINIPALQFNESCSVIVDTLSEPLRRNFGIKHFGCIRIFENGKFLRLATNAHWTRRYFERGFYNDLDLYNVQDIPKNEVFYRILMAPPESEHCRALCSEFNFWNFFFIYERNADYCDFWFFASARENTQIINFYLNNKKTLEHFILYFREKAAHLFEINDASHLIATKNFSLNMEGKEAFTSENFAHDIQQNKYFFAEDYEGKKLSNRELECLFFVSQGRTMKEISERLGLSLRTVEMYINNAKTKLNCHTKSELSTALHSLKTLF